MKSKYAQRIVLNASVCQLDASYSLQKKKELQFRKLLPGIQLEGIFSFSHH